jgi:hypothetical protein
MKYFTVGQTVLHPQFGTDISSIVKTKRHCPFKHGLEECVLDSLQTKRDVLESIESGQFAPVQETVCRVLAEAIVSVNDNWDGSPIQDCPFASSALGLSPRAQAVASPFLVADDVGLGKTIEAGLILWPLLAKSQVKGFW